MTKKTKAYEKAYEFGRGLATYFYFIVGLLVAGIIITGLFWILVHIIKSIF